MLKRNKWLSIFAAVVALLALVAVLQPQKKTARQISTHPTIDSLTALLNEADADLMQGETEAAIAKYRQAQNIDPKTPGLDVKLKEAQDKLALNTAELEDGEDQRGTARSPEPGADSDRNNDGEAQLNGDEDQLSEGQSSGEPDDDTADWEPADLDDPSATPASILPPVMPGYKITQNGWLRKPRVAGATYVPRSPSIAREIHRVLLTVGKHETTAGVAAQLAFERELFSVDQKAARVNRHSAQFALYDEPRPDVFPILTSLNWTRGNWFFSVQIAPLINRQNETQPSTDFKRGIAIDVAKKLGY